MLQRIFTFTLLNICLYMGVSKWVPFFALLLPSKAGICFFIDVLTRLTSNKSIVYQFTCPHARVCYTKQKHLVDPYLPSKLSSNFLHSCCIFVIFIVHLTKSLGCSFRHFALLSLRLFEPNQCYSVVNLNLFPASYLYDLLPQKDFSYSSIILIFIISIVISSKYFSNRLIYIWWKCRASNKRSVWPPFTNYRSYFSSTTARIIWLGLSFIPV